MRWAAFAALAASFILAPRPALAIPIFANGNGGVSCEQCHSAPPNLNAYGRYILATNFSKGFDPHAMMRANERDPVSVEFDANGPNADPALPRTVGSARFLGGGYLGQAVTFYASVPVVSRGFSSPAVDQVWAAYNGFSQGNGSLQVGKFPTPILAPWLSQSLSLSNYALASMPVGANSVGVGDNRYGASYTQTGGSGLIGTAAFLTNTGPIEQAFRNTLNGNAEGQSFVGSLQFLNPSAHFTGGVAMLQGSFPLPSGAHDRFDREMALLSYSTSPMYSVNAMALVGYDRNPNDDTSGAARSNGMSVEAIVNPTTWAHVNLRVERTNDGLGSRQTNYVTDVALNPIPNLIATVESVSPVGGRPITSYQLLYAGPWLRRPLPGKRITASAAAPQVVASAGATSTAAGGELYATECIGCHGAHGQGGVGPSLVGIAKSLTSAQTISKIEQPGGTMPRLYPGTISEADVVAISAYIRDGF